jgi:hypothetical protein
MRMATTTRRACCSRDIAPLVRTTAKLTDLQGYPLVARQFIEGVGSCTEALLYRWRLLPYSAGAVVRFNRSLSKLATLGLDSARRSKFDLVISGKGLNEHSERLVFVDPESSAHPREDTSTPNIIVEPIASVPKVKHRAHSRKLAKPSHPRNSNHQTLSRSSDAQ